VHLGHARPRNTREADTSMFPLPAQIGSITLNAQQTKTSNSFENDDDGTWLVSSMPPTSCSSSDITFDSPKSVILTFKMVNNEAKLQTSAQMHLPAMYQNICRFQIIVNDSVLLHVEIAKCRHDLHDDRSSLPLGQKLIHFQHQI
jgi:hypothetical protein